MYDTFVVIKKEIICNEYHRKDEKTRELKKWNEA